MLERRLATDLRERLGFYPGVVLLGPRQVGKTTLARAIAAAQADALVLDLERPGDRAQLAEPELFLAQHRGRLVVLDEVQMLPELFAQLRPEIDADRRAGRFLLLGSASGALLRQRTESLAGRVGYLELTPLLASELPADLAALQQLWQRGGFPQAQLAPSDALSYAWRQDFIQTFLQRDLPQMGVGVAADPLHRFWRMLAHLQGQLFNASQLGMSLGGASHSTATRYLDLLVDTLLVRRLEPFLPNVGKRLVKSPKVYIRDSGLVHALLNIASLSDLQGHPVVGASWEGFVVEQVRALLPAGAEMGFYRTAAGAELDIVVQAGSRRLGIEVKFSAAPSVTKGFWQAVADLQPQRTVVVAPVARRYPLKDGVEVVPVWDLPELLAF
ncbi:ATP-binding protein [Pseudorhodoferax sp.]|uniref:ATP-binding protein n=1 Tax=Pseudorhodoferax sp. TaxID=1993553 RepID=UPI002DD6AEF5|nr:ATP-binding protein [Pseudorhodoferax sp.]